MVEVEESNAVVVTVAEPVAVDLISDDEELPVLPQPLKSNAIVKKTGRIYFSFFTKSLLSNQCIKFLAIVNSNLHEEYGDYMNESCVFGKSVQSFKFPVAFLPCVYYSRQLQNDF